MGSDGSEERPERRFRTLFISDVHLGARGSQADRLLDFLRTHDADTIYLVGDIVDGWALKSNWYWPQSHNDFVQKMLRKARKGAKIIYVPGNHDEFLRNYYGTHFGGIDVVENYVHLGADGRRYLVIHGDIFDLVVQNARWLAHLGDKAYEFAIQMNRLVNFFAKNVRQALLVAVAMGEAEGQERGQLYRRVRGGAGGGSAPPRRRGRDLRPHPLRHHPRPARHPLHNCGDWVESCTALAEHEDGRFEIITWTEPLSCAAPVPSVAARAAAWRQTKRTCASWSQPTPGIPKSTGWCGPDHGGGGGARSRGRVLLHHPGLVPHASACRATATSGLALPRPARSRRLIAEAEPDAIHIATEGPIGVLVRRYCRKHGAAVHDELSHPLSRLCLGARAGAGRLGVGDAALVPWAEQGRHGGYASAGG